MSDDDDMHKDMVLVSVGNGWELDRFARCNWKHIALELHFGLDSDMLHMEAHAGPFAAGFYLIFPSKTSRNYKHKDYVDPD